MGNREMLSRLRTITKRLRRGRRVTVGMLAEELEVDRRTILRDIKMLRNEHGAPIEYDTAKKSYVLTEPNWSLLPVRLNESELLHLVLAAQATGQFRATPLAGSLRSLFRKLREVLVDPIDLDPDLVAEQISFFGGRPRPIDKNIWRCCVRAIRSCRRLHIQYRASGYTRHVPLEVEPVHLACQLGDWYLIASRTDRDGWRSFALSRIRSAALGHAHFTPPPFDPKAFFAGRSARFVPKNGRHAVRLRARFAPEAAEWIRERQWHPDQRISEHRDGSLTLQMPIGGEYEALRWVLQWGSLVRVLSPEGLRKRVQEEARAMLETSS